MIELHLELTPDLFWQYVGMASCLFGLAFVFMTVAVFHVFYHIGKSFHE